MIVLFPSAGLVTLIPHAFGDDPKYEPTLDLTSYFFALALSASGVNAYTGHSKV